VRGELVIVVAGAEPREIDFPDAVAQVLEMVRTGVRLKDAAAEVAAHTGHSSRELYQAALAAR
jgi:16S rRNA (cytidine1402-2'-O)-methyltransferase